MDKYGILYSHDLPPFQRQLPGNFQKVLVFTYPQCVVTLMNSYNSLWEKVEGSVYLEHILVALL